MPSPSKDDSPPSRPLLVSLCGTWLKPEMQSVYRQVTGLRRHRSLVLTERVLPGEQFPFESVVVMERRTRARPKGNFIRHFWRKHILGTHKADGNSPPRGNFLRRLWYKHILRRWPLPVPPGAPPPPKRYPYNLPALLSLHQPALVHVYYGHKAVKYLDMLLAWGGPFMVSFHGVDVVKFTEDPAHTASLRRVFEHSRLVLGRSRSLLDGLRALGCPDGKLRLNLTPIPLDKFPASVREAPPDGAWRLVQASRLIPKKGLFTTLEALRLVVPEFPELKFTVCGTGPVKEEFLRRRDELGLKENVKVPGWLDQAALLAEYRRSHLFLHPSELTETSDQEGIPNAMLEAMATGLPVVATLHGGIPEAVTHNHDGLLVPERSPRELADALLTFLRNPEKLPAFSEAAARSVRRRFGLEAAIGALEDCYEEARTADVPRGK